MQRFKTPARDGQVTRAPLHNDITYLIVYALVEKNTQRPPIGADIISMARIDLGRKVGECAGLARQDLAWNYVGSHILAPSQ